MSEILDTCPRCGEIECRCLPGYGAFEKACDDQAGAIEGERLTLGFSQPSRKKLDAGRESIEDSPLFGGARQKGLF